MLGKWPTWISHSVTVYTVETKIVSCTHSQYYNGIECLLHQWIRSLTFKWYIQWGNTLNKIRVWFFCFYWKFSSFRFDYYDETLYFYHFRRQLCNIRYYAIIHRRRMGLVAQIHEFNGLHSVFFSPSSIHGQWQCYFYYTSSVFSLLITFFRLQYFYYYVSSIW